MITCVCKRLYAAEQLSVKILPKRGQVALKGSKKNKSPLSIRENASALGKKCPVLRTGGQGPLLDALDKSCILKILS